MINSTPLIAPAHSFPTGSQNPQPDGSFTLTADGGTGAVFSVQRGQLATAPAGSAGPDEKMWPNPGGASVNIYASDGLTYCYQYDGQVN